MSMSERLTHFLSDRHIKYDLVRHSHSQSSLSSAAAAQVPVKQLAKAVILEDHQGRNLMAVLPAMNKVSLSVLGDSLNRGLHLAKEKAVYNIFADCDHGAVPPVGEPYHMDAVYDDLLLEGRDVYFEAGDHEHLVHVSGKEFAKLAADAKHLRFSHEVFH
ncbi:MULTISPECIES: YbaK/EbsC family protein [Shewanella]|uniref:YbaK/EbsC family protein n=2 Tax=Shewanella TaxID=22 RepID=A0A974XL53_9GAMM|nr:MULTISPECIES: YbaK/EbsC family protein [Shewanella]QSX29248.1 YbaK/EbsC family protein [Shewanella cyperi]QSX36393.1 YbaK/EbsC family protein [Shewanella sedimentimangrovi]QSX39993.1 YbaK/EbsC family protein [Shewanella cyperi]